MRKTLATLTLALSLGALTAAPALGDISTTQHLPAAACNQGTMNAHNHIPPVPGNGMNPNLGSFGGQTNGHNAVPGTANVTPCGHGG
ncbi:MAG TPA: hypothetical protein VJ838_12350 [Gaiellaceae bacterium]|nr:hypothetical protein [Gaiellaceae bacterium]